MEEREYRYWFYTLEDVSGKDCEKLVKQYGSIKEIFYRPSEEWERCTFLGEKARKRIANHKNVYEIQKECEELEKKEIKYVSMEDPEYPKRLQFVSDKPKILFYKGQLPKEEAKAVAVIGARDCSNYGKTIAREIGEALAQYEISLISGMARGIDGCAQESMLKAGGVSYGVLGCGVDICYPKENGRLYEELIQHGGVISELKPGTPARAIHFPRRNRIISGLADVIVVVEAQKRSGTSITVGYGLEQGKEIMAVPGRIKDSLSKGCNLLISQGASPLLEVEDILWNLGFFSEKIMKNNKKIENPLAREQKLVYDCLDFTPKNVMMIAEDLGENIEKINELLFDLEIEDKIEQVATGYYVRRE